MRPPPKHPIDPNKGFLRWRGFTVTDLFLWAGIGFAIGLTAAGYL